MHNPTDDSLALPLSPEVLLCNELVGNLFVVYALYDMVDGHRRKSDHRDYTFLST